MNNTKKLLTALLFTAASSAFVPAMAETARQMAIGECNANGGNSADCACAAALNAGTRDALEDFKLRYRGTQTACDTQASSGFDSQNRTGRNSSGSLN